MLIEPIWLIDPLQIIGEVLSNFFFSPLTGIYRKHKMSRSHLKELKAQSGIPRFIDHLITSKTKPYRPLGPITIGVLNYNLSHE